MGSSMEAVLMNCTASHRNYLPRLPVTATGRLGCQSGRFGALVWHQQGSFLQTSFEYPTLTHHTHRGGREC